MVEEYLAHSYLGPLSDRHVSAAIPTVSNTHVHSAALRIPQYINLGNLQDLQVMSLTRSHTSAMQTRLEAMLLECEQHINANHDVHGLCRQFPRRLAELVEAEGGRPKY